MTPMENGKRRRVRHSEETKRVARIMHEGGWTPHEIQQQLAKQGVTAAFATIKAWVDPEYQRARSRGSTEASRRWRDASGNHAKKRMLELHDLGFSFDRISTLMAMYHGRTISVDMVRYFIHAERDLAAKR